MSQDAIIRFAKAVESVAERIENLCGHTPIRKAFNAGDETERIQLVTDILLYVYGDKLEAMLEDESGIVSKGFKRTFDESKVVRDWRGRFAKKGSSQLLESTHDLIKHTLKKRRTKESVNDLVKQLEGLTVKQLHELKKRYGIKASGRTKKELLDKVAHRLDVGRRQSEQEAVNAGIAGAETAESDLPKPDAKGTGKLHPASQKSIEDALTKVTSEETRKYYRETLNEVLDRMPQKAIDAIVQMRPGFVFYDDTDAVTQAFNSIVSEGERVDPAKVVIGGFYRQDKIEFALDGSYSESKRTMSIYAHELTHCIDHRGVLSNTDQWKQAWDAEIKSNQLTEYATTSESEGMAEFGAMLYSQYVDHKFLRKMFPQSMAFFESRGLLPGSGSRKAKRREVFEGPPVKFPGGHGDKLKNKGSARRKRKP